MKWYDSYNKIALQDFCFGVFFFLHQTWQREKKPPAGGDTTIN